MKKLALFLILPLLSLSAVAQEADTTSDNKEIPPSEDVIAPSNPQAVDENQVEIKDVKDTTKIKIGKKTISIVEDESGTSVKVSDVTEPVEVDVESPENESESDDDDSNEECNGNSKMDGHWSGFYWGINNFLNSDHQMSLPADGSFMDLNTGRSWNIDLNFVEHSFGFGTDRIGLVTGMGLSFNNFHFDGNNNVQDSAGLTRSLNFSEKPDKSKLSMTYLNVPLLLEFQFPNNNKDDRAYISAGVIGGIKIGSHSKVEYLDKKDKKRDDFNLSPLRYAFTARVGFKDLTLYGNYYPVRLFEKDKGPELYPFDLGLALTF